MINDDYKMYSKPYFENNVWKIDITSIDNDNIENKEFSTEILAKKYIDDMVKGENLTKNSKNKKTTKESVRDSLKDFINDEDEELLLKEIKTGENLPIATSEDIPTFNQVQPFDFDTEKRKGDQKARRLMDSMLKLYLSQDLIDKQEYIRAKTRYDQLTLSQLYTQLKISEHAIETMIRAIDRGEIHPRMFEVLGGLQSRILEIMKHQTLHMMAAEENLKKLKHDIDIYDKQTIESHDAKIVSETKTSLTRGSRDMMKELQTEIAKEKGHDITDDNTINISDEDI